MYGKTTFKKQKKTKKKKQSCQDIRIKHLSNTLVQFIRGQYTKLQMNLKKDSTQFVNTCIVTGNSNKDPNVHTFLYNSLIPYWCGGVDCATGAGDVSKCTEPCPCW